MRWMVEVAFDKQASRRVDRQCGHIEVVEFAFRQKRQEMEIHG